MIQMNKMAIIMWSDQEQETENMTKEVVINNVSLYECAYPNTSDTDVNEVILESQKPTSITDTEEYDSENFEISTNKKNKKKQTDKESNKRTNEGLTPQDNFSHKIQKTSENNNKDKLVFIKLAEGNIHDKNPRSLLKALLEVDNTFVASQIKQSKENIRILCTNHEQKSKFMNVTKLLGLDIIASEHTSCSREFKSFDELHRVIIFGVTNGIPVEEIKEDSGAKEVKRMYKKNPQGGGKIPTENIILSYSTVPPQVVSLGYRKYKTTEYFANPLRCYKCQHFGHSQNVCRGKITCPNCAGNHSFSECQLSKGVGEMTSTMDGVKCVNCNKNHSAGFRGCEVYLMQKEIIQFKTIHKISFAEAAKSVKNIREIPVDINSNQNT